MTRRPFSFETGHGTRSAPPAPPIQIQNYPPLQLNSTDSSNVVEMPQQRENAPAVLIIPDLRRQDFLSGFRINYVNNSIPKDFSIWVMNFKHPVRKSKEAASWSVRRLVYVALESQWIFFSFSILLVYKINYTHFHAQKFKLLE